MPLTTPMPPQMPRARPAPTPRSPTDTSPHSPCACRPCALFCVLLEVPRVVLALIYHHFTFSAPFPTWSTDPHCMQGARVLGFRPRRKWPEAQRSFWKLVRTSTLRSDVSLPVATVHTLMAPSPQCLPASAATSCAVLVPPLSLP